MMLKMKGKMRLKMSGNILNKSNSAAIGALLALFIFGAVLTGLSSCTTLANVTSAAANIAGETGLINQNVAKSISASWKLPLYRLDFATVQGMYVGQSEQQLRNALATAEEVSPCVLWIDEIEKGLSGAGGSGDGGVSTRMVGQFLFWLQECRKNVFVVATANDVSMLPSELLRRGRFDELFFVDLPTADERRQILSLYMRKYLSVRFEGAVADKVVEITDGFTGADLESTVRDLAYHQIGGN